MSNNRKTCRNCGEWLSVDGVKGRCAAGGIAGWVWHNEGCNRWCPMDEARKTLEAGVGQ